MRKIWWLPVICIAAGAVQALSAADESTPAPRKGFLSGRSRLLIYSKNKTQVPNPDAAAGNASATARVKLSDTDSPIATKTTPRGPSGDTGTVSPSSTLNTRATRPVPVSVPVAAKQRNLITPGSPIAKAPAANSAVAATPKAEFEADPSDDLVETDDVTIRKLFEDVQPAIPPQKKPVSDLAARPESTSAMDSEKDPFAKTSTLQSNATTNAGNQARQTARYQALLDAAKTVEETPVAQSGGVKNIQNKIQPVAGHQSSAHEFEVNPFESSDRPSQVVNAGLKEEAGGSTLRQIQPASATAAAPKAVAAKTPVVKAPAFKMPENKKPVTSLNGGSLKSGSSAKDAPTKVAAAASPAANNQAPQVDVTWEARGEVTLGEQCHCVLIVKNNGKVPAKDIIVEASFPESVRLVESTPFPKSSSNKLEWQFGNLSAGEKKTIDLTMIPTKRGELAASAQVRFTGTAATSFQVSEPMLTASVKIADEVQIGEPAPAIVTVSNPGTGTAQNVVVQALLPVGLESTSGKEFSTEIGPLGPGETRTIRLSMVAVAGGTQSVKVIAKSTTGSLEHISQGQVKVLAPSIKVAASGPSVRYVHRAAKYTLTATNNSNTATENVRISQVIAAGFDYVKADHGGRWDAQSRTVSWYVGHLDAGRSAAVELELTPQKVGDFRHAFKVSGDSGVEAMAMVTTRVEAAASLVMEVKDADDPIEIGSEMTYEIRIRNEGSKAASKVAVSCELPPDVELVKVDGPTGHLVESGVLIFRPAPELAANDSLVYKVTIKGTVAGSTKLRARLTSESIQKPLIVEEATQFYAE